MSPLSALLNQVVEQAGSGVGIGVDQGVGNAVPQFAHKRGQSGARLSPGVDASGHGQGGDARDGVQSVHAAQFGGHGVG